MIRYFDINNPGVSIKCKIICEAIREVERVVVFSHGFGGHKDNKAAERFAEAALSKMKKTAVLIYDWPCHGSDVRKKLTLTDCDMYLTMVLDYIKNQMKVEEIYSYSTSFGAYLVLKYIHDHECNPFRKVACRCPAVCMGEIMYSRVMSDENKVLLQKGKDIMAGFDRKVLIDQAFLDSLMDCDIREYEYFDYADDMLIIHGTLDEMVPFEESRTFAENNVIEFVEIDKADHRFQDLDKLKLAHSKMIDFYMNRN